MDYSFGSGNDDDDGSYEPAGPSTSGASIDRELQAAIEYKIAVSGADGAATVLKFLDSALRRHRR